MDYLLRIRRFRRFRRDFPAPVVKDSVPAKAHFEYGVRGGADDCIRGHP